MNNEFKEALEQLNSCIATIKCGCTITPDEGLFADSIYYRCKEYIKEYENAKYWETSKRNKQ